MWRTILLLLASSLLAGPAAAQTGWAVFASGGSIYISSVGGSPKSLYSGSVAHAVWSAKAKYIYFIKTGGEIWRMNNDGSGAKKIASGKNSGYNPIAGYRPDDGYALYTSGSKLYRVSGSTGAMTQIHSGSKTWVGEVAIDSAGKKAAARDSKSDTYRINVGGSEAFYDAGCSASVSADGNYLTANVSGHVKLKIYKWSGGIHKTLNAPSGGQWDNQKFAVNSSDWVVYKYDNTSAIGLVRVSDNKNTKICSKSSDYPDFFLGSLPPVSSGCTSDTQCADSDPCTKDTCSGGTCSNTKVSGCCTSDGQCGDSDPCTKDTCSGNTCSNTKISGCCKANSECADSDPCTADLCSTNKCQHSSVSGCCTKDSQCSDGNACTKDTCSGNTCQHASISGCCTKDADCKDTNPCTKDTCDAKSGNCSNAKISGCCAFDTDCDDKEPCTLDTCGNNNKCVHTPSCAPDAGPTQDAGATRDAGAGDSAADLGSTVDAAPSPGKEAGANAADEQTLEGGCAVVGGAPAAPPLVIILLLLTWLRRRIC